MDQSHASAPALLISIVSKYIASVSGSSIASCGDRDLTLEEPTDSSPVLDHSDPGGSATVGTCVHFPSGTQGHAVRSGVTIIRVTMR